MCGRANCSHVRKGYYSRGTMPGWPWPKRTPGPKHHGPAFPFLDLPLELREMIYLFIIHDHFDCRGLAPGADAKDRPRIHIHSGHRLSTNLGRSSKLIKEEMLHVVCTRFIITFSTASTIRGLPASVANGITHCGLLVETAVRPSQYAPQKLAMTSMRQSLLAVINSLPRVQVLELTLDLSWHHWPRNVVSAAADLVRDRLQPLVGRVDNVKLSVIGRHGAPDELHEIFRERLVQGLPTGWEADFQRWGPWF